jgi:hypothetical protein
MSWTTSNGTVECMADTDNAMPGDIPGLPQNITTVIIHGRNASYPPMVVCCTPNPVHLVDSCFVWCEVPPAFSKSPAPGLDMLSCLHRYGWNGSSVLTSEAVNTAARRDLTVTSLTLGTALFLVYFMAL